MLRPLFVLSTVVLAGAMALHYPLSAAPPAIDAADKKVASKLESVLRERVTSPNGNLRIIVKPTARSSEGYFDLVQVEGAPAKIKKLPISSFYLDARNVRVDVPHLFQEGKVRTLAATTKVKAVISEDDLTNMLAQGKRTKEMGLKVKYVGKTLSVTGQLNYALLSGPVAGSGRLRLVPGHKVHLDIMSLKLRGVEVPQFVKNQFSERINPVIDYQDVPFNPPFKGLTVAGPNATIIAD